MKDKYGTPKSPGKSVLIPSQTEQNQLIIMLLPAKHDMITKTTYKALVPPKSTAQ